MCALKLDMNKVYDRVDGVFLRVVLIAYGLNVHWCNLVMACIASNL